jgi:hypothetical protein
MDVYDCGRCQGSGHVTGGLGWEIPWPRWAPDGERAQGAGILPPHICPDCNGAGKILDMTDDAPHLPWESNRSGERVDERDAADSRYFLPRRKSPPN